MIFLDSGSQDVSTDVVLRDSTTGDEKTGVVVTTIDTYYHEQGAAISTKVDCTALAAATSAHTDGGAFEVGQGIYRIDWEDAAFDGGRGKRVTLVVKAAGCKTVYLRVLLGPSVNVIAIGGTTQTAADLAADLANLPTNAELATALAGADDAVLAAIAALSAAGVTVASPVASSGDIEIVQADDYYAVDGRSIAMLVADPTHALGLDSAEVRLHLEQATWTATSVAVTTAGYTVHFEPTTTQTALITSVQDYQMKATLASGHVVTLSDGTATPTKNIPEV